MSGWARLLIDKMGDLAAFTARITSVLMAGLFLLPGMTAAESLDLENLVDLSLEQLTEIKITSVAKQGQRLSDATASIYVITNEAIHRAGVSTIPEALRLAPNLQVARVDARQYAITARGFNSTTANKLLVLIDGRTVYTPLFSGVFWDAQDILIEDIDRIEVISGPGATLWGANAVNGVINVITKSAKNTQGGILTAAAGDEEQGYALRYGGHVGEHGRYRLYGKFSRHEHTARRDGVTIGDEWDRGQVGFRTDWNRDKDNFTFQGDAYRGRIEQLTTGDIDISGANLLARWSHRFQSGDNVTAQVYFDHTHRDIPGTFIESLNVFDIELQHVLHPIGRHRLIWGGGYRYAFDDVENSAALAFLPDDPRQDWANIFVQDEISLTDELMLTLGVKVATNPYTDFDYLPSARLAWKINHEHLLWAAISRAVRAPSRIDTDFFVPGQPPFLVLAGGPGFRSEISNVFETGYRAQLTANSTVSISVFHHIHDHLRTLEPRPGGSLIFGNEMEGETTGLEAWGTYRPTKIWRLSAGGFLLNQKLRLKPGSANPGVAIAGNDPDFQWLLRSSLDLPGHAQLDVRLRRVGALPDPKVPAYTAVDARLGWLPFPSLELSITGQNLFDDRHPEFGTAAIRSEIERSYYFKLLWSF